MSIILGARSSRVLGWKLWCHRIGILLGCVLLAVEIAIICIPRESHSCPSCHVGKMYELSGRVFQCQECEFKSIIPEGMTFEIRGEHIFLCKPSTPN